jgi:quercetin dioxygenase-like cupin family protein
LRHEVNESSGIEENMLVKDKDHQTFDPVIDEGVEKVRKAVLVGPEEGAPNFYMRHFELDAGGFTPYHQHDWEHVVYVLSGSGTLKGEERDSELKPGSAVLVKPNEMHQFRADADTPLAFLCMIPKGSSA